jgi:NADP-dependent 3-hydroxy acid dehydrogenase YdfG
MSSPSSTDLRDQVALVTGASSGIGEAIAGALAQRGMRIVITARRSERLTALARALERQHAGLEIMAHACDLRDTIAIERLFAATRERFGGVDVLVNSAGLGRTAPLCSGDTEAWREMLEVNVLALCVCTREAITDMRRRGNRGHVLHVASMASHRVPLRSGVYSASKFAVRALTEGLRRELREDGSKIRVTALSPGFVETEFAEVFHGSRQAARETYGRFPCLQPDDVARAALFVLTAPEHVQVHDVLMRPTEQVD